MNPAKVIAEIGCNHKGNIQIAKEMIETAKYYCKVYAVKFQKRNVRECLSEEEYNAPHNEPHNSYGESYGKHREYLEFTLDEHKELKKYCESLDIIYSSSVWDMISAKEIVSLDPVFIKIPSACNTHLELLKYLCENFGGDIHLSLGMTTMTEEAEIVRIFKEYGRNRDVVLYACTSGYPIEDEDTCLFEIKRLKEKYSNDVKAIGFSGHNKGIAIDIGAFVLGAQYIERHFTLDRTWKGTDHAASLEPEGLRRVNRDIGALSKALSYKNQEILNVEKEQRKKLKWDRHCNSEKEK